MIILYFVWPYNRLPRQKSWTLAGGVQQHLAVPLYIKSYDYGNVVLCCEILQIQIHLYGHNYLHCITIRAVATAPEKTPTEKVKFFELRDHHQSIPCQKLP